MKPFKWIGGTLVIALLIIAIVKTTQDNPTPPVKTPVKIGAFLPLTGDGASYGEPIRDVVQLAVNEINSQEGIHGAQLELRIEDSGCNGKDAATAMTKLATVDKVQLAIGGVCSSEALGALPIAEANKVALLSPTASSPDLSGKSKFFARVIPSDDDQGESLAEASLGKDWRRIGVVLEQQDYPKGVLKVFKEKIETGGSSVVTEEFAPNTTDFKTQLAKLKDSNIQALLLATQAPPATQRILEQLQDMDWRPQLLLIDTTIGDTETLEKYASLLEGAIGSQLTTDEQNPKFKHLKELYQTTYSKPLPLGVYTQLAYDTVFLLADALKQQGNDGTKISEWLHTRVNAWPGASGSLTIDTSGNRLGGRRLHVVKSGKAEIMQ
jgi:branched-chain amino acid transport system substrate-binding protein